jgi:hypothetical protein
LAGRRLRSFLEPVLYLGIAALFHGLLFLIPGGSPAKKERVEKVRGVRIRSFAERPAPAAPARTAAVQPPPSPQPQPAKTLPPPSAPPVVKEQHFSMLGSRTANGESFAPSTTPGGAKGAGVSTSGAGGSASSPSVAREGAAPKSEFGNYLSKLQSSGVQGWAKESAQKNRQGWKGNGSGGTGGGEGWLGGPGGSGSGQGGSGTGRSGSGTGGDGASAYMDPRVRMVVTSYPPTGIERRYTQVPYPNLKFKKNKFNVGWCNVYLKIKTDSDGTPVSTEVLRPENEGVLERQFLDQVKKEVGKWTFDPKEAEIHVDVRFYVE